MDLKSLLAAGPLGLDTALFIYLIEEHAEVLPQVDRSFSAVAAGDCRAATSALTLLEVLVLPYRAGNLGLVERYEQVLGGSRGLELVGLDRPVLHLAARLRAESRLRTPDAIQMAAALHVGCSVFVTNDRDLPSVRGLRVVQLRHLVG